MREYFKGFLDGNLTIDPTSWHAKLYWYWRPKARFKTVAYKENLCHYVRVVIFWAPLMWMRRGRVFKVPVWSYLATAVIGALIAVGLTYWTDTMVTILIVVGAFLTLVGLIVLGFIVYDENPQRAKKVATVLTVPLWGPIALIGIAVMWLYELQEDRFNSAGRWFVQANYRTVVRPWTVLLLAGITTLGVLDLIKLLEVMAWLAGWCLVVGVVTGLLMWVESFESRPAFAGAASPSRKPGVIRRAAKGTAGTVKVAGHYAMAKKKGICPFISFGSEQGSSV